jgi:hypothetical protein
VTAPGIAVYASGLTVATAADVEKMVAACDTQLVRDFCPAYARLPLRARWFADKTAIPKGTPTILVSDVCDDPEALAYHTEGTDGRITGLVGAQTVLDDSGDLFRGAVSVSGALSHEILETAFDPFCNKWFLMPDGRRLMAGEVCDPVQDQAYDIPTDGGLVAVSSFVLAPYWDDSPPRGAVVDYLGALAGPFTKTPGGYYMVSQGGRVSQVGMRPSYKPKAGLARSVLRGWGRADEEDVEFVDT